MKESDIRREVFNLLRRLWYWPITQTDTVVCPQCHTQIRPPKGRPDILALSPTGKSIVVEVKILNLLRQKSFPFSAISDEQRQWLDKWEADHGVGFIALGTVGTERGQRELWMVEWGYWKQLENMLKPYQDSIPHIAGKGFRKELQNNHLDLVTQLETHELLWKGGCWHAPCSYHFEYYLWPEDHLLEREL